MDPDTIDTNKLHKYQAIESNLPNGPKPTKVTEKVLKTELASIDAQKPPTVYGELSILGYNGCIPNIERVGRRNRSKFLLCKRSEANGIRKHRSYVVKQPQTSKAFQDKDQHSILFTFDPLETVIVEYTEDDKTDMFQIGRSSEDPIDFVVMDTVASYNAAPINPRRQQISPALLRQIYHYSENSNDFYSPHVSDDILRLYRLQNYGKEDQVIPDYTSPPPAHDQRSRLSSYQRQQAQAVLLNYPQPNISNMPPIDEHLRNQYHSDPINFFGVGSSNSSRNHSHGQTHNHHSHQHQHHHHYDSSAQQQQLMSLSRISANNNSVPNNNNNHDSSNDSNDQTGSSSKRSNATQSTISRFACRILVDRKPPYEARIYAAGFDSSSNIFLGEKATKWGHDSLIDGLTTNGVLLMHRKSDQTGGVWREVSVDGGIYAIRESRSAAQKGSRIKSESNVLKDGTLIDLCGATLLWRSVDGFKASPTKKSLEEKIDMLNACRPQCPVGLNTLVIPRKPVSPNNHRGGHHKDHHHHNHHNHNHHNSRSEKSSRQPYVYLKCGHVQGYHDWGTIDNSNQRTCPICRSVGSVAKLSMGIEPSFYIDNGQLTHVFNPCGHMASEKTVEYWSSIKIPHGTHFFHSICPFCATPLAKNENAFTRLIFQEDLS